MTETKTFMIGDVLSITTGRLVSHDGVQGVFNLLDWMTDETIFHYQVSAAMDVCKPFLEKTFPQLTYIDYPVGLTHEDAIFTWVDTQGELHGEHWEVPKLPEGLYESGDPVGGLFLLEGRLKRDHD